MSLESTTASVVTMAENADSLGASIKFAFNGGEGVIFLDGTSDPNKVSNEDKEADCTVKIDLQDFIDLVSGDLNPMNAFMGGKLVVEGDMGVAMKLSSLFG